MPRNIKSPHGGKLIAVNRRARHDYLIEDQMEAGLALEGWEAKSLRAGRVQLAEGYVQIRNGEAYLIGAHFSPLNTASSHVKADPTRSRKLLLHRHELDRLIGAVERKRLCSRAARSALAPRPGKTRNRPRQRQEAPR